MYILRLGDHVLLSTRGREADDGGALAGTETAFRAGDSPSLIRADHDGTTLRGLRVLHSVVGEHYGNRSNGQVGERIGMGERVCTQVNTEAVSVGFLDRLAIDRVGQDVMVRKCKAAASFVRMD